MKTRFMQDKLSIFKKWSKSQSLLMVGQIDPQLIFNELKILAGDSFLLDEEDIKIEKVRELIRWISLKPLRSQEKVAIILGAERLTHQAANALLKTLEEPPSYAQIILVTTEEQAILPTILSRLQKIRMPIGLIDKVPEDYLEISQIRQMPYFERFKWAAKAAESKDLELILVLWQEKLRQELLMGNNVIEILEKISEARGLLRTNISVKLLLENLTLYFD